MDSIYEGNRIQLCKQLESILSGRSMDRTWSQDDDPKYRHNRYRDLIMAYLVTPNAIARSEMPKGYGKTDIFFERTPEHPPVIIEIKTTVNSNINLEELARTAPSQIDDRMYAEDPAPWTLYVWE